MAHANRKLVTDELYRNLGNEEAEACLAVIDRLPAVQMWAAPLEAQDAGNGAGTEGAEARGGMLQLSVTMKRMAGQGTNGEREAGRSGQRARVFAPR
jgi:hypothetical protein